MSRVVAVVGGGVSGLAAARVLAGAPPASLELRDGPAIRKAGPTSRSSCWSPMTASGARSFPVSSGDVRSISGPTTS